MSTSSYKLIASIPTLNFSHSFDLEKGRRYLLGSATMEPGMLVFSRDRSISRRQAWLEVVEEALLVERHPKASQKLNAHDTTINLRLKSGESFTVGVTIFRFVDKSAAASKRLDKTREDSTEPEITYTLSARDFSSTLHEPGARSFLEVVTQMPGLMQENNTPAEFLLALCETLQSHVHDLQVTAWRVERREDGPEILALPHTHFSNQQRQEFIPIVPSRRLVKQAFALTGDEAVVSMWGHDQTQTDAQNSIISSGAQWAMCVPIALSKQEEFALYATGKHMLVVAGQREVQQVLATLGALAKQHLIAARVKERRGQIGQFFSPALRTIMLDTTNLEQALKPGEHEATICFFDLRGSSRLAENSSPPTHNQPMVANYFARLEKILGEAAQAIFQTGGIVIDFQGDAILGCWGVPHQKAPPLPARQAVVASKRIVELMQEHDWPVGDSNLRCGIGITSGKVLAGLFTAQSQNQALLSKYTVMGPSVNQASRLEGMTKKFAVPILIDGAVAAALDRENIIIRRIAAVRPAGMSQVVQVYELVLPAELGGTGVTVEGARTYEAALALFEKGDFEAAAEAMRAVPRDQIELFLSEQIILMRRHDPPPDWEGVINLAAK